MKFFLDYALELLLLWKEQKHNILLFLANSRLISKSDNFKDCNKKVFELIQLLAKLYRSKIKPYANDIVNICTTYLHSEDTGAIEKEAATEAIHELLNNDGMSEDVVLEKLISDIMSVFSQKKQTARLQQHMYELLGKLSKNHHDKFVGNKAVELRNRMMNTIQSLFKDDKVLNSMMVISGAIDGLRNHLINFTPSIEEDPNFSTNLYECMVQLSDPDKHSASTTSRVAFRNMLQLLHQHGHIPYISNFLLRDFKMWHQVLNKWTSSKTYDDKNVGIQATQTFHQQIADEIELRVNYEDKKTVLFFMKYFQDTLESAKSQPHEIRIAIRGFGAMAASCKIHLEPEYLSERFDLVMQRTEYSYHTHDRLKRREVLEHLPYYVESLSKIMNQLSEISGIQLEALEAVFVTLIKDFHYLSTAHHSLVAKSMLEAFANIQKLGKFYFKIILFLQKLKFILSYQEEKSLKVSSLMSFGKEFYQPAIINLSMISKKI